MPELPLLFNMLMYIVVLTPDIDGTFVGVFIFWQEKDLILSSALCFYFSACLNTSVTVPCYFQMR